MTTTKNRQFDKKRKQVPDEVIFEVTEAVEGGYNARALEHSIFTQANMILTLRLMDSQHRRKDSPASDREHRYS